MPLMDTTILIKGMILGFSIALPVGPIGILCIRRSLLEGWTAGLLTGLGAATADAIYGSIAALGLAGITRVLVGQRGWIQIVGGLFLCYLGLRILLAKADIRPGTETNAAGAQSYLSALILTLTNPMTILSFTAIFAGMGLGNIGATHGTARCLVTGVFLGSMVWWFLLSSLTSIANTRLNPSAMTWVNRCSGAVLTAFGMLAVFGRFFSQ